jgi:Galactose oxidase, central domain/Kelch motif
MKFLRALRPKSPKEKKIVMNGTTKLLIAGSLLISTVLGGCSSVPGGSSIGSGSSGSGGTTGGPFTIGGTVSGLATGASVVLQDNGGNNLTVTANGSFTFTTEIASGKPYAVTVLTQPANPAQTCTVTAATASGTATANVTTVAVTCTTNTVTATIGGTVSGLVSGTSVILQDNGGDSLTVTANGAFTFKTPVTGPTDAYAVTVLTQPTGPNQICAVAGGSGTATANVTSVAVTCVLSYTIGGTVTGVVGTGLILEDSAGTVVEKLTISPANGNQAFTFTQLVPTGTTYTVTIFAQPTGPTQTCTVTPGTGSGTATANVTSVAIVCPAVTYSIGGTVVGLEGMAPTPPNQINLPLTDNSFEVQNNLGNTLNITENGPFVFATPEALNDQYQITIEHAASTQTQACTRWDYKGVVTGNITNIVVDCAHNDWTWIDGGKIAGVAGSPIYGSFPTSAPTTTPDPFTNTPGVRYGAVGWTDKHGSLFLFGGDGFELAGSTQPDTLDAPMNDMWVCDMSFGDYCQWQLVGGYDPTPFVPTPPATTPTTVGGEIILNAQHEGQGGTYNGVGNTGYPRARLGATAWTDNSGNFWLFGGSDGGHFLNDLWEYDPSGLSSSNYTTTEGQWTWRGGSDLVDQVGNYTSGTLIPGSRTNAVTWTDASGNLWLFGGFGYDGQSPAVLGFLNDLWEYKGGNWIFVSGGNTNKANQNGIYGTQGTAASTNMPGGRQEAAGWADANGNLWLFAGEGEDSVGTANGILNDLWVYNIANNQWTWVTGSDKANQTGTYPAQPVIGSVSTTTAAGTCGLAVGDAPLSCQAVSLTGALPGSRWGASAWIDAGGNLWLFGGWGLDSTGTNGNGALNDTWVYTPNATAGQPGTWAWVKGSNTGAQNGIYGDMVIPYKTYEIYTPGGRSNSTHWVDLNNQLWLFGGLGYDSTSTTGNGYLNDTWRYLPYR